MINFIFFKYIRTLKRYLNGRELHNSNRITIIQSNDGPTSLYIPKTNLNDSGIYEAIARNENGIADIRTEVYIERMFLKLKILFLIMIFMF